MTTKEKLVNSLEQQGLFNTQAKEIVELAIPELEKLCPGYRITWDKPAEEYPSPMYVVWFIAMKPIALKWINEHAPMAWFKSLFE